MSFDPKKYGAKEVKKSGGVDLSKYGATEVEEVVTEKKKESSFGTFGDIVFNLASAGAQIKAKKEATITPQNVKDYGTAVRTDATNRLKESGIQDDQLVNLQDDAVLGGVLQQQANFSLDKYRKELENPASFMAVGDETRIAPPILPKEIESKAVPKLTQEQRLQEISIKQQRDLKQRQNDVAVLRGAEIAAQNPTASPREIGAQVLKIADPDTYKIWEKTGFQNRNIARQAEELGVQSLAASGNENAITLATEDIKTIDERFPEQNIAMVRQKMAAKAYEKTNKAGATFGKAWTVGEMDDIAKDLSEQDRQVYEKHIRGEEEKLGMWSTNMPNWGLAKFGQGAFTVAEDIGKYGQSLIGNRGDKEVADEILSAPTNTRFQNVGESQLLNNRRKQLYQKQNEGKLTANEYYELDELNKTINARGAAQKFLDGTANATGNVAAFALLGRTIGTVLEAVAGRAGIMAGEASTKAGIEGIAETAMEFGIKRGLLDKVGLLASGYVASDNQNAQQALVLFPDDKDADKRTAYKQLMNWATAGSELMFNDVKVIDAFKRVVSPRIVNVAKELSEGIITSATAKLAIKDIVGEGMKIAAAAGKNTLQEGAEEVAPIVVDAMAKSVLAPEKLDLGDSAQQAWDTFTSMMIDGALVGAIGGVADYRQSRVSLPFLSKLGRVGFDDYTNSVRSEIARQEVKGEITPEQAAEKNKIIELFTDANKAIDGTPALAAMEGRRRDKYAAMLVKEKMQQEKVVDVIALDPVAAQIEQQEITDSQKERKGIVTGEKVVTDEGGVIPVSEAVVPEPAVVPTRRVPKLTLTPETENVAEVKAEPVQEVVGDAQKQIEENADTARTMLDEHGIDGEGGVLTLQEKDNIHGAINDYEDGKISGEELYKEMLANGMKKGFIAKYFDEKLYTTPPSKKGKAVVGDAKGEVGSGVAKDIRTENDFSNEKESYRVIVGDEAFNDILESGVVRTNADRKSKKEGGIDLGNRPTAFPSFSKGKASMEYAAENPNNYIIVTEDASIQPSKVGRHGKGTTMFPTDENGNHLKELSGGKVKVYKHIGDGKYELVYANGKAVEQSLPTQSETKTEVSLQKEKDVNQIAEEQRLEEIKATKPTVKLELVPTKDLVNSQNPLEARAAHNEIKDRYKKLKALMECL